MRTRSPLEPLFEVMNMIPIEIPPNTVMLKGIGWDSNIYLVRDENEALIIDTGTGVYWHKYIDVWLNENYLKGVEKITIFNTHEHFDHVGGNIAFRRYFEEKGFDVYFAAHKYTAEALESGDDYVILSFYHGRSYTSHEVHLKLSGGEALRVGNLELIVIHTPGHTRGSTCLYEPKEKLLFTGDTIFNKTVGRTDFPTGSLEMLKKSLQKLEKLDVYLGLPGHGRVIKNWKENLEYVKHLLEDFE